MNFTKSCIASTLTLLACLHSSSFLLCMFMRLRASDCLHLHSALRHASIRKCQYLRSHTLKTWRLQSLPARILICQVPPLMFFCSLHGMAPLQKWPHAVHNAVERLWYCQCMSVHVSACQCRPPAKRCQKMPCQYPNVVSNTTFSWQVGLVRAGLGLVGQNGQRSKLSRGTSGLEPDSREVLLALIQLWTRQAKDYGGLSYWFILHVRSCWIWLGMILIVHDCSTMFMNNLSYLSRKTTFPFSCLMRWGFVVCVPERSQVGISPPDGWMTATWPPNMVGQQG